MSPAVTIPFVRTVPTGIFEIVIFVLFSVANMEAKFNKLVSKSGLVIAPKRNVLPRALFPLRPILLRAHKNYSSLNAAFSLHLHKLNLQLLRYNLGNNPIEVFGVIKVVLLPCPIE
jgi:hypothetical protein